MDKLLSIQVKNLRSLEDTGCISLNQKITVLVGKNSTGKSTFARLFPLLRQTAEVQKREPILWYGRFVDFGSFSDALKKGSDSNQIEISFSCYIKHRNGYDYFGGFEKSSKMDLRIFLQKEVLSNDFFISKIEIKEEGDLYILSFDKNCFISQIEIDDYKWEIEDNYRVKADLGALIPILKLDKEAIFFSEKPFFEEEFYDRELPFSNAPIYRDYLYALKEIDIQNERITNAVISKRKKNMRKPDVMRYLLDKNKAEEENINIISIFYLKSKKNKERIEFLKQIVKAKSKAKNSTDLVHIINNATLFLLVTDLLRKADSVIEGIISNYLYIEPIRATAERYYRNQGLNVREVDSKGVNVPFFIKNFSIKELKKFNEWFKSFFEIEVSVISVGGHLSINIEDAKGLKSNLADVGFGVSQILPVALQLWSAVEREKNQKKYSPITVIIEQPELHLHPEYQSRIADLLVSAVENKDINLIVETHSSSIINRLGALISEKKIDKDEVQILLFDKEKGSTSTKITKSDFDDDGVLINWPFGFFEE